MKPLSILGIVLILFGIISFAYQGITYTKRETVAQVGSVQVSADKQKTIWVSPITSGVAIVLGIVLVGVGRRKN